MSAAGLPAAVFDPGRLAAVRSTGLLDTEPEEEFDALTRLAAEVTGARRAFVTVVDDRRSFWKSCVGVPDLPVEQRQNLVHESPCHILIATDAPLISEDARQDVRMKDVPAVEQLGIGAWAGVPVHDRGGFVIGGLCVVADEARDWSPVQVRTLHTLAEAASAQIKLRQELDRTRAQAQQLEALARQEQRLRAEAEQRADAAAELAARMRVAAAAQVGVPHPGVCQLGGADGGCDAPAEIKVADSWGDSAWGCPRHVEEVILNVRSVFIASEELGGLGSYLRR
ncbi:GAF domain-containing protein [Actinoplanes sp. NPDC023714]|uniref:GAF domain-containing protein n=1 Tax=Actinoplanes sp. NPDC023714 TaxID=3154322 RepID=UPI0033FD5F81